VTGIAAQSVASQAAPGALGFLVVAGMGIILYFVFRSMAKHLRKISVTTVPAGAAPASVSQPSPGQPSPGQVSTGAAASDQQANAPAVTGPVISGTVLRGDVPDDGAASGS
jgi:hypothetical protein